MITRGVRLAAVGLLAIVANAGCSFWSLDGGGPVEKDTAYRLHGRAPWKVADRGWKDVFENSFAAVQWNAVPKETLGLAAEQAAFRQSTRRNWGGMFLLGWSEAESRILLDKAGGKTERLFGSSGLFLPAFPVPIVWHQTWNTWFSLDRGEELATREYYGLGPLGLVAGYTHCVQPADIPQIWGNPLYAGPGTFGPYLAAVVAVKGDDARYHSQWAWHILGGLVAWGRVDLQYYAQVAWVPVPLWRMRE